MVLLLEESEMMKTDAEAAYKLGDRYISIQQTEEGIDYSIYNEGYELLDGGMFDDPEMTIEGALKEITEDLKQPVYDPATDKYDHVKIQGSIKPSDVPEPVDYDDLMERVVNHISETEAYLQGLAAVTEIAEQNQKQDKERLDKATEYKPLAKVEELTEQNYNMIDNMLNNMPKPPVDEEEQKREKLRRIREDKINRRNTSMKERIAQKKALIAVKDAQKTGLANHRNIPGSEMDN